MITYLSIFYIFMWGCTALALLDELTFRDIFYCIFVGVAWPAVITISILRLLFNAYKRFWDEVNS